MKSPVNAMYPNRYFLTLKEVCGLTTYSPSTIWRMEQREEFPKREKISKRRIGWRKDLVFQFLNDGWNIGGTK